ncbi:MAG: hypothetical protein GYB68_04175 [Chloroflexi bacterium]|nr:hypothetical protein [Chloroflexota bacterium]
MIAALLVAFLAALPLFIDSGFLNTRSGGDSPFLLFRLHQLEAALADGHFPARWMPDAAFGLGYPFFNYYAALPFYVAWAFRILGFSYVISLKLTHLLGFLIAAAASFAWVRRFSGQPAMGFLASAAYTLAPFHMVNVYVRGDSLSEFWAMAWFPLILLALHTAAERPSSRRLAVVALSFGALVMTHNVSALIFAPFVAIYGLLVSFLVQADEDAPALSPLARIGLLGGAGLLGLALAAWVWLPALAETGYVQLDDQTTGFFFYGEHFRGLATDPALVQGSTWAFDYDSQAATFSMGLIQASLIAVGLLVWIINRLRPDADRTPLWQDAFAFSGLLLSTLMITPLAEPIWAALPLLPFAQFPWRFLSIQALFGALMTAQVLSVGPPPVRIGLAALLTGALLWAGLGNLRPTFIPLTDHDVTAERLQWYESFSGNIGTTIRHEYLPRWTMPRPYTSEVLLGREPRAKFLSGSGQAERLEVAAAAQTWSFAIDEGGAVLALPLLYFPGWRAQLIDAEGRRSAQPVSVQDGLGSIRLDLAPGNYQIRLWLGRTPVRLAAELASLAGLVAITVLLRPVMPGLDYMSASLIAAALLSIVVASLVLRDALRRPPLEGLISADFGQQAYFYPLELPTEPDPSRLAAPPQQAVQGAPSYPLDSPPPLSPGLYFPQFDGLERPNRATLYGAPLVVPAQVEPTEGGSLANFGSILLHHVESSSYAGEFLVRLLWEAQTEVTQNYAVALRLIDQGGHEWAALDTQAGAAGLYPTGLWRPGEVIPDHYRLDLPDTIPPGGYILRVTLYDSRDLSPLGSFEASSFPIDMLRRMDDPCSLEENSALSEGLFFDGLSAPEEQALGDPLTLSVAWQVCEPLTAELTGLHWVFSGPDGDWEATTPLASGSDPVDWLTEAGQSALVSPFYRFDLPPDLTPGSYQISLQGRDRHDQPLGAPLTIGTLELIGRERVFSIPEGLAQAFDVSFGDQLKLWGATLTQDENQLNIDVTWGALTKPSSDYMIFIHLFDPATEEIVAQLDTMPRAFGYPTSRWLEGEVVSDSYSIDLSTLPPGSYRIGLGWYQVDGPRLPTIDADGQRFPADRVLLPDEIIIP